MKQLFLSCRYDDGGAVAFVALMALAMLTRAGAARDSPPAGLALVLTKNQRGA
ncbi:hypothetical protein [Undibacterium sp. TJN19]|uniref:hypothetical protein n=1 Tax=Undibacterium sp. TJN19 TaxID=3413055 RepID=UPI003BF35C1D